MKRIQSDVTYDGSQWCVTIGSSDGVIYGKGHSLYAALDRLLCDVAWLRSGIVERALLENEKQVGSE